MGKYLWIALLMLGMFSLNGQKDINTTMIAHVGLESGEQGNDIWGYVDADGNEYAILGTTKNTKIYSLVDPSNPEEIAVIPGVQSIWRDMKVYKEHIYVTTDEKDDGLLIIDVSMIQEDSISHRFWKPELTVGNSTGTLNKCHNIYIDTEQGYGYLAGCNLGNRGVIILDLNNQVDDPIHVGEADLEYSHDAYVKDDRLYSSELYTGKYAIYDVSDKSNPIYLGGESTTTDFTHNAWSSDDGKYLFTTDEKANAYVDAFDISDINEMRLLDSYKPIESENNGVIPHNTHYKDGFLFTSWYTDGLIITDVNDPSNMVQVASFDTWKGDHGNFNGCWGVYPYLPSGLMLLSDIQEGLYVISVQNNAGSTGIQRASYLSGKVTDINTGEILTNASIEIISEKQNIAITDALGSYKTGIVYSGSHQVIFSHPNYDSDTLSVDLISGEYVVLDAALGNFVVAGKVENTEGEPIVNAQVLFVNTSSGSITTLTTDESGEYGAGISASAQYKIYAAAWGYKGVSKEILGLDGAPNIILTKGYEDDFFADLGWETSSSAVTGDWELDDPELQMYDGSILETDSDLGFDIGSQCYVTEKNTGDLGENDIDGGTVVLTSPNMDFSEYNEATIELYYFYTFLESGAAFDDAFTIKIDNGSEYLELFRTSETTSNWTLGEFEFDVTQIEFTENMRLVITASDEGEQHFTEAQVDHLLIELEFNPLLAIDDYTESLLEIYPNPTIDKLHISLPSDEVTIEKVDIISREGKKIKSQNLTGRYNILNFETLPVGTYFLKLITTEGEVMMRKITKM